MKIYNIFYLNLLQKASTNPLINQVNEPISLIIFNNKEKWEIKNIFDMRNLWKKV